MSLTVALLVALGAREEDALELRELVPEIGRRIREKPAATLRALAIEFLKPEGERTT
jgi:site-specific recombinase